MEIFLLLINVLEIVLALFQDGLAQAEHQQLLKHARLFVETAFELELNPVIMAI